VLCTLGGFVAGALVFGNFLPKDHSVTRAVRLRQPPEAVWRAITDYPGMAEWRTDLRGIQRLPDLNGNPVWKEISKGGTELPFETVEAEAPHRMVRRIAGQGMPFGGTWTYEIHPIAPGECELRIREDGEVYSAAFRVVSRFANRAARIERFLQALAKKFGEEPRIA
jgi:uncharacterized protein YndB with AHSA1/START domain